jgi:putative flippase GtrA
VRLLTMRRRERACVRSPAISRGALERLLELLETPALFALVGASNTVVDLAVFWFLTEMAQVPPLLANVVSYSLGAVNSFTLNKLLTFRDRDTRRSSMEQLLAFAVVKLVCLSLSSLVLVLTLLFMASVAAKLVSIVVTFVFAYTLNSRLVFR